MKQFNKQCCVCGQKYFYCPSCGDNEPVWRTMFDDENCMHIFEILSANGVGKANAEETLERLNESCDLDINFTASIAKHIARLRAETAQV